jgi:hypothetical protein
VTDSTACLANSELAAATSWARVLARFSRPISALRIGSTFAMHESPPDLLVLGQFDEDV